MANNIRMPVEEIEARGTGNVTRLKKHREEEAPYTQGEIEKPEDMSPAASLYWDKMIVRLEKSETLCELDEMSLEILCETYAAWKNLRAQIGNERFVTDMFGDITGDSPAQKLLKDYEKRLTGWLTEFGMTPASRLKVRRTPKKTRTQIKKEADPISSGWEDFE